MTRCGRLADGREVTAIELGDGGLSVRILDYGARLTGFRRGQGPNACVASEALSDYEGPLRFFGPVVAPVINRIAGATAEIEGRRYRFEANQGGRHTLHSGPAGTHNRVWTIEEASNRAVTLSVELADGEGGFPGNRRIAAHYRLHEGGLELEITAATDASTLMNPGHHGVWNPDGTDDWSGLNLQIPAAQYLPVDDDVLPTGEVADVAGTVFDHRAARAPDPGLDHNLCFKEGFGLRARLTGVTGRWLEIHSDAPGLQAYAGGRVGIALEPQLWPDAPHHAGFPSILLRPGETFRQRSRFELGGA